MRAIQACTLPWTIHSVKRFFVQEAKRALLRHLASETAQQQVPTDTLKPVHAIIIIVG